MSNIKQLEMFGLGIVEVERPLTHSEKLTLAVMSKEMFVHTHPGITIVEK